MMLTLTHQHWRGCGCMHVLSILQMIAGLVPSVLLVLRFSPGTVTRCHLHIKLYQQCLVPAVLTVLPYIPVPFTRGCLYIKRQRHRDSTMKACPCQWYFRTLDICFKRTWLDTFAQFLKWFY